jgi:Ser/Thr protein kinase RdoA (MazF antagonist)
MNDASDFFATITVPPPDVSTDTAEAIALERWGISARAKALTGERDRNFYLRAADGREFVLKFANPAEKAAVRDMQIEALRHLERVDPGLATPRIIPLPDGALETTVPQAGGAALHARLLTWVGGEFIYASRRSAAQRVAYGRALARLQLALRDFSHPASDHPLFWDLRNTLRLREIADAIPHAPARAVVGELLDEFETRVTPHMPTLRRQVLHNDVHGHNTFVDPADHDRIVGVIDFGDMVETAVVFDVAIAATAQRGEDMPRAEALGHFFAGFHAVRPLLPTEIALLPLLIATRVAMGLTLASWHRHKQPDNPHFTLTDESFQRSMTAIAEIHSAEVAQAVRRACGMD